LASSRLQRKTPATSEAAPRDRKLLIILSASAAVIVLLLGIIILLALRGNSGDSTAQNNPQNNNPAPQNPVVIPKTRTPNFLGQALTENTIAYLLDRGDASKNENRFDMMKQAVINSVKSLGPERFDGIDHGLLHQ